MIEKEDYYIQTNFSTEKEFNTFAQAIKKGAKRNIKEQKRIRLEKAKESKKE